MIACSQLSCGDCCSGRSFFLRWLDGLVAAFFNSLRLPLSRDRLSAFSCRCNTRGSGQAVIRGDWNEKFIELWFIFLRGDPENTYTWEKSRTKCFRSFWRHFNCKNWKHLRRLPENTKNLASTSLMRSNSLEVPLQYFHHIWIPNKINQTLPFAWLDGDHPSTLHSASLRTVWTRCVSEWHFSVD